MKTFKKVTAFLLAAIMVLAMAIPTMAATPSNQTTGKASDTNYIYVEGVEAPATVIAYQIIEAVRGEGVNGTWTGDYKLTAAAEAACTAANINKDTFLANMKKADSIDPEEVGKVVAELCKTSTNGTAMTLVDGKYQADVPAGQYIVLVQGSGKNIYNPMVVANAYGNYTDASGATVSYPGWASNNKVATTGMDYVIGNVAKVKKTTVGADKKQLDSFYLEPKEDGNYDEFGNEVDSSFDGQRYDKKAYEAVVQTQNGDDVMQEATIPFELTADVPNYNKAIYKAPYYALSDALEKGKFEEIKLASVKVYVNDALVAAADDTYSIAKDTSMSDNGFKVTFASDYITSLQANSKVKITYVAKLAAKCDMDFDANNNRMKLEYTNNPNRDWSVIPDEGDEDEVDFTNTYTFKINFVKHNDQGEVFDEVTTAQFTLYSDSDCTKVVRGPISPKADGTFSFDGLDKGTYYLKETKAPDGFKPNPTKYTVVITPEYAAPSDNRVVFNEYDAASGYYLQKTDVDGDGSLQTYTAPANTTKNSKGDNVYGPFTKPTTVHDHTWKLNKLSITVNGVDASGVASVSYNNERTSGDNTAVQIKNTKTSTLPSTGGMGTYIFTALGIAIMAIAASLLVFKRRRA